MIIATSGGSSYGRSGRPPPTDQNLGLVMVARLRHGGKFPLKSLTFGNFLCKNVQKALSFSGASPPDPNQGLCLWTPLGAPPPDPRLGSRSARSPWSAPLWQILDPPLIATSLVTILTFFAITQAYFQVFWHFLCICRISENELVFVYTCRHTLWFMLGILMSLSR